MRLSARNTHIMASIITANQKGQRNMQNIGGKKKGGYMDISIANSKRMYIRMEYFSMNLHKLYGIKMKAEFYHDGWVG